MGGHAGLVGDPGDVLTGCQPSLLDSSGVRGEQALDGWGQSFPEPNSQEFPRSTAPTVNSQPVGVFLPICNSLPPGQVSSLSSPWVVSDGFIAFLFFFLWARARSSSRRLEPSSMEVEPKKLKGKRDLIVTKSFQQVDFWCK